MLFISYFRTKATLISSLPSMAKMAPCFICSEEFSHSELTKHEKTCLENIQGNNSQFTRQSSDLPSPRSLFYESSVLSNSSAHSSNSGSSAESCDKKFSRCYICGTDVPNYLSNVHEKSCKKSWESGLLNSISTPARKSASNISLSRAGSRTDLRKNKLEGGLRKAKSVGNVNIMAGVTRKVSKTEMFSYQIKPEKSKSSSYLNTGVTSVDVNVTKESIFSPKTKSVQHLKREGSDKKRKTSMPHYIECRTCGKQYSSHSIAIHVRQCEKTVALQKNAGTKTDYKKKSRSLHNLTAVSPQKPALALAIAKPADEEKITRPSTALGHSKVNSFNSYCYSNFSTKGMSPSMSQQNIFHISIDSNCGTSKKNLSTLSKERREQTSNITCSQSVECRRTTSDSLSSNKTRNSSSVIRSSSVFERNLSDCDSQSIEKLGKASDNEVSRGLQKCYICNQLFGSRSLPIHERQCLKKWECKKTKEKIKEKRKKPLEIKLIPFGTEKGIEEIQTSNSSTRALNISTPFYNSHATNSEDFIQQDWELGEKVSTNPVCGQKNVTRTFSVGDNKENDIRKIQDGESPSTKFVGCIFCGKKYGNHSINIHEKSCRERKTLEENIESRLNEASTNLNSLKKASPERLSKSMGDISRSMLNNNLINGENMFRLVECDGCQRKFLSGDIKRHRIHCQVSVL